MSLLTFLSHRLLVVPLGHTLQLRPLSFALLLGTDSHFDGPVLHRVTCTVSGVSESSVVVVLVVVVVLPCPVVVVVWHPWPTGIFLF